jgi:hypothetical protein
VAGTGEAAPVTEEVTMRWEKVILACAVSAACASPLRPSASMEDGWERRAVLEVNETHCEALPESFHAVRARLVWRAVGGLNLVLVDTERMARVGAVYGASPLVVEGEVVRGSICVSQWGGEALRYRVHVEEAR